MVEDDHVVAYAGVEVVVTRFSSDQILTRTRVNIVVTAASRHPVIARFKMDVVVVAARAHGDRLTGVIVNVIIGLATDDIG